MDRLEPNDRDAVCDYLKEHNFHTGDLIDAIDTDRLKQKLKTNTDECLSRGGFGVPSVVVGNELFWGFDDLGFLEKFLAGEDPLKRVDVAKYLDDWKTGRALGIHRRR